MAYVERAPVIIAAKATIVATGGSRILVATAPSHHGRRRVCAGVAGAPIIVFGSSSRSGTLRSG
jgi:hypothetical protein